MLRYSLVLHFYFYHHFFPQAIHLTYILPKEFDDERDADDAIRAMDGNELDGARIVVEPSHGGRGERRSRSSSSDECFNCGGRGHW